METQKIAFKPSLTLIVLDAIGAVFVGLGLVKMFAGVDFFLLHLNGMKRVGPSLSLVPY